MQIASRLCLSTGAERAYRDWLLAGHASNIALVLRVGSALEVIRQRKDLLVLGWALELPAQLCSSAAAQRLKPRQAVTGTI